MAELRLEIGVCKEKLDLNYPLTFTSEQELHLFYSKYFLKKIDYISFQKAILNIQSDPLPISSSDVGP